MSRTDIHNSGSHEREIALGPLPFRRDDILRAVPEFEAVYDDRPIRDNTGGMQKPHLFATWYMLRSTQPAYVVESGVWKGLGTWLIEQAVPDATIYSIDPILSLREYISDRVTYLTDDFSKIDWNGLEIDRDRCVLFFDDHQNALERVRQMIDLGFRRAIFEDNYPPGKGDHYTLKKALMCGGHYSEHIDHPIPRLRFITRKRVDAVRPNNRDKRFLYEHLDTYYEFPPVVKPDTTRWDDAWDGEFLPTADPLFGADDRTGWLDSYRELSGFYTWICWVELGAVR